MWARFLDVCSQTRATNTPQTQGDKMTHAQQHNADHHAARLGGVL